MGGVIISEVTVGSDAQVQWDNGVERFIAVEKIENETGLLKSLRDARRKNQKCDIPPPPKDSKWDVGYKWYADIEEKARAEDQKTKQRKEKQHRKSRSNESPNGGSFSGIDMSLSSEP